MGEFSYSTVRGFVSFFGESELDRNLIIRELRHMVPGTQHQRTSNFDLELPYQELELLLVGGWRPSPHHTIQPSLMRDLKQRRIDRNRVFDEVEEIQETEIEATLNSLDLQRSPTPFQRRNLSRMLRFRAGATFSVPGAGKTSEAICYWLYYRRPAERLLISMPKVASISWRDEFMQWLGWGVEKVVTLNKPATDMRRFLQMNSTKTVFLVNYDKMRVAVEQIAQFMATTSHDGWSMILDESHYIKNNTGATSLAARNLSSFVDGIKLIMTGTPAPQGPEDLRAQAEFLQGLPLSEEQSRDLIERVYVRTSKEDLELLAPIELPIIRPHKPSHQTIYDSLFENVIESLTTQTSPNPNRVRPHMMTLRRAATDPFSLEGYDLPHFDELPWKFDYVIDQVKRLASEGKKVIIWSTFVSNLIQLETLLIDFDPAIVFGAIPSDPLASSRGTPRIGSREWMFEKFKNDDNCSVLLANPAACGESISLHHWCDEAIYFERSYNAAHFLQSKDRIHRYGQHPKTGEHTCREKEVTYQILITEGSIDEHINNRLNEKIEAQEVLLSSGQFHEALEEDGTQDDVRTEESGGASHADIISFLNSIG